MILGQAPSAAHICGTFPLNQAGICSEMLDASVYSIGDDKKICRENHDWYLKNETRPEQEKQGNF